MIIVLYRIPNNAIIFQFWPNNFITLILSNMLVFLILKPNLIEFAVILMLCQFCQTKDQDKWLRAIVKITTTNTIIKYLNFYANCNNKYARCVAYMAGQIWFIRIIYDLKYLEFCLSIKRQNIVANTFIGHVRNICLYKTHISQLNFTYFNQTTD